MRESNMRVKKKLEGREMLEITMAVAWAVFQHHNGGGSNSHRHHGAVLVQRATRFKIEAEMKDELERVRLSTVKEALPSWDAGSTLFDKYELDSVFKHLDFAFQSVETQQTVYDGSEFNDETAYSSRDNHYTGAHAQHPQQYSHLDQRSRHGYGKSEEERSDQQNWFDAKSESQRFRDNYLETVDESLPLANVQKPRHGQDINDLGYEDSPQPKFVTTIKTYDDTCKNFVEVVPQGKAFQTEQLFHSSTRWNVLGGRRCSFDTSPDDLHKESKQSRKVKLLNIFKSKSSKDGSTTPKSTRQARIAPDDSSQRGWKGKPQDPHRKSGELKVVADTIDTEDLAQGYSLNAKGFHQDKAGSVQNFSRAVRLSSDMRNPNVEEGFRNHLQHGDLRYGTPPASPRARRKTTYSLNVAPSPVQTPRRSMLSGSRDDLSLDDEDFEESRFHQDYHHHYHHHHHHIGSLGGDFELTVPDIVKRAARQSFEETAHRRAVEDNYTVLKTPRNSLENPYFYNPPRASKLFL